MELLGKSSISGGLPGIILQNLIKVTSELAEKDGQDEESLLTDLTRLYNDAAQRLQASGSEAFIGETSRCLLPHAGLKGCFDMIHAPIRRKA